MGWGIRRRLAALLGLADSESTPRDEAADADPEPRDADADEPPGEDGAGPSAESSGTQTADGGATVGLYECPACAQTYVSEGLDACPRCGGDVDSIANERDLGMA